MVPVDHRTDHDGMFILYAVVVGLAVGLVSGGSAARLGRLHFRWGLLIALGMVLQLSLFSTPIGERLGLDAAKALYVTSNLMVLAAVAVNRSIPGLVLVLVGGLSNVIAIVANGGSMPVSEGALQAMQRLPQGGYSNSVLIEHARLVPLTDIFAMPTWIPAANVFSVGDVLIGLGAAIAVVAAMHGRGPLEPGTSAVGPTEAGASVH